MIFKDQTAMLTIVLKEKVIVISRHTDGINRPSLQHQLQEYVMLHGVLTEIETLAFGKEEGQSNNERRSACATRQYSYIYKARATLPTR